MKKEHCWLFFLPTPRREPGGHLASCFRDAKRDAMQARVNKEKERREMSLFVN